eukprot:1699749-Rhodomonas_salina.1
MSQEALQPSGGGDASKHSTHSSKGVSFPDVIENVVEVERHRKEDLDHDFSKERIPSPSDATDCSNFWDDTDIEKKLEWWKCLADIKTDTADIKSGQKNNISSYLHGF